MDGTTSLREQMKTFHDTLEAAIGDCTPEALVWKQPGSTINSVGAIYAHTIFGEDGLINGLVRGQTPVYFDGGWAQKIGLEMPQGGLEPDWNIAFDLDLFRQYAAAVYQATDDYLATASATDLARVVDPGFAPAMPVQSFIGNVLVWHVATHQGEISALKGVQGFNGLAFAH
jgi:hypothetical protein